MRLEPDPSAPSGYRMVAEHEPALYGRLSTGAPFHEVGEVRGSFDARGYPVVEVFDGGGWVPYVTSAEPQIVLWRTDRVFYQGSLVLVPDAHGHNAPTKYSLWRAETDVEMSPIPPDAPGAPAGWLAVT